MRRVLLNQAMQQHQCHALIPPTINTPRQWLWQQISKETPGLHHYRRSVNLASVLVEHPKLFPFSNRWQLSDQLLALFEAIEENQLLGHTIKSEQLNEEAKLIWQVYQLWKTYSDQEDSEAEIFYRHATADKLADEQQKLFVCDFGLFSALQQWWIQRLEERGLCIRCGDPEAGAVANKDGYAQILSAIFTHDDTSMFRQRLQDCKQKFSTNPVASRIAIFNPLSLEEHAFGLYLKIAGWLSEGRRDIAVVTQDRKLSRRLRALLDDKGIPLRDYAGWSLLTSSSSAGLAALLAEGQTDCGLDQLTMLASSPFCMFHRQHKNVEAACHALRLACTQADILPHQLDAIVNAIPDLNLDRQSQELFVTIGEQLLSIASLRKEQAAFADFFQLLFDVMRHLGLWQSFTRDRAGRRIIEELTLMHKTAASQGIEGHWRQWRQWVIHVLEHHNFIPPAAASGVCLYNLKQSWWLSADAIILAAMDNRYMRPAPYQPFSDKILAELGVQTSKHVAQWIENQCHQLLKSAATIVLSWQARDGGQSLQAAAWLDSLQHFCQANWNDPLIDKQLTAQLGTAMGAASHAKQPDWPGQQMMPAPTVDPAMLPTTISANAYQSLSNCPYQFFSRYCLKLRPQETAFSFSRLRYGKILHRCLYRFHHALSESSVNLKPADRANDYLPETASLPKPLNIRIDNDSQQRTRQLAQTIVDDEFSALEQDHYQAHHQKLEASQSMEKYIDWLFDQEWLGQATFANEVDLQKEFDGGVTFEGRADCIIHAAHNNGIIDYKSGRGGITKKGMTEGDTTQLLVYALLAEQIGWVCYLFLDKGDKLSIKLEDDALSESSDLLRQQIEETIADYGKTPLPAWAHEKTCRYCPYSGVCRRNDWYV